MTMYSSFAAICDYPEETFLNSLDICVAEFGQDSEGQGDLNEFRQAMAPMSLGERRETYTNAFDLRPECTPNLGYHLFGDDARRGLFLAELKGRMEACGVSTGTELPDHISLILQYLDRVEEERGALLEECLLPAVTRMSEVLVGTDNPYELFLRGLLFFLRRQHELYPVTAEEMKA